LDETRKAFAKVVFIFRNLFSATEFIFFFSLWSIDPLSMCYGT
jgi:hypothetical protein